jgi:DNA-binding response OmpR family regulator
MTMQALIVEDDGDLSVIFSNALNIAGFDTQIAHNGKKAQSLLASITPHLIVLDLHLPDVSGLDILQHIHTEPRLGGAYVIVTTADANAAQVAHEQKADMVLIKPVSFGQMRDLGRQLKPVLGGSQNG